jgi:hypothetical protein
MTMGSNLRADCARCFGLCCVAPAFSASADFAIDKAAGEPCPNLLPDFRCSIHDHLRQRGFPGCAAYDCFGAGQRVSQETFGGRRDPEMLAVFETVRSLHELLWHLTEAQALRPAPELTDAIEETERLAGHDPDSLLKLDVRAYRREVGGLLAHTSLLLRAGYGGRDLGGADLIGKSLRGADLTGADLSGAYLIRADLRDADARMADLRGADLRGADLRGADLSTSVFLTRFQVGSANGDDRTKLPKALDRPAHWR